MGKRHGVQPQNGIPGFSLHFSKEFSYGYSEVPNKQAGRLCSVFSLKQVLVYGTSEYFRFEGNGKIPMGR